MLRGEVRCHLDLVFVIILDPDAALTISATRLSPTAPDNAPSAAALPRGPWGWRRSDHSPLGSPEDDFVLLVKCVPQKLDCRETDRKSHLRTT